MKKYLLVFAAILLTGCNIYIIDVDKSVCVHGEGNSAHMSGSDLKDVSSDPTNDVKPTTTLPVVP